MAEGWHQQFGGPHAERVALSRVPPGAARGATCYTSLEPCNHVGKTPPCSKALIDAGIARCVIGRRDENPPAVGGAETLRDAGMVVDVMEHANCRALTDPFTLRSLRGRPWVCAKWAQTIDGAIASREGRSQWISNRTSRRAVHRSRARVDTILTGVGTVIADDPMLTARHCRRVRRVAQRVVFDPDFAIPIECRLTTTTDLAPTIVYTRASAAKANPTLVHDLHGHGVKLHTIDDGKWSPDTVLRHLSTEHDASIVWVEAGGGLVGKLLTDDLLDELVVYIGPVMLGDHEAMGPARGRSPFSIADGTRFNLKRARTLDGDVELVYRRHERIGLG